MNLFQKRIKRCNECGQLLEKLSKRKEHYFVIDSQFLDELNRRVNSHLGILFSIDLINKRCGFKYKYDNDYIRDKDGRRLEYNYPLSKSQELELKLTDIQNRINDFDKKSKEEKEYLSRQKQ